jgi:hypothetical protein
MRNTRPTQRNRVILKSVDADVSNELDTTQDSKFDSSKIMRDSNNNSIFGGHYRPRLALNQNTTIELAEAATGKGPAYKNTSGGKSPFASKQEEKTQR